MFDQLSVLADKYGTDKGPKIHNYTPFYNQHLCRIKESVKKILEIGILEGKSLKMWRDYFCNSVIHGLDIYKMPNFGDRIRTHEANQSNRKALSDLINKIGSDFDVIIDDGGHENQQQQISFGFLFPFVKSGGFYIIEDLQYSFIESHKQHNTYDLLRKLQTGNKIASIYMTTEEADEVCSICSGCYFYEWESPIIEDGRTRSSRLHISCVIKRR